MPCCAHVIGHCGGNGSGDLNLFRRKTSDLGGELTGGAKFSSEVDEWVLGPLAVKAWLVLPRGTDTYTVLKLHFGIKRKYSMTP